MAGLGHLPSHIRRLSGQVAEFTQCLDSGHASYRQPLTVRVGVRGASGDSMPTWDRLRPFNHRGDALRFAAGWRRLTPTEPERTSREISIEYQPRPSG